MTTYRIHVAGRHGRAGALVGNGPETALAVGSVLLAAVLGLALPVSPLLAVALVVIVGLSAVWARYGVFGIGVVLTAVLPWLVVVSDVLPRLAVTFTAAASVAVLALIAKPENDGSQTAFRLRLGMVLFFVPMIVSIGTDASGAGLIQAAKLVIFPLMVWVVTEATNRPDLLRLRTVTLWSSIAAISANFLIGMTGLANVSYYQSGDILGYAGEHTLAVLAGCVVAACLAGPITWISIPVVTVAAAATVATGVRSVLPGLALVLLLRMLYGQVRIRVILLVAMAVAAVFASGAAGVVEARFHRAEANGEFTSFSSLGSGRGGIYTVALDGWWNAGPFHWVVGTGLRSILRFEEQAFGTAFVGHSDVVEVGVQLGVVGLVGLALIWWVLIERAGSRLPLLVLASLALFNGVLEYGGVLVICLLLAVGSSGRTDPARNGEAREPHLRHGVPARGAPAMRGLSH
jgi:hypothetical protein